MDRPYVDGVTRKIAAVNPCIFLRRSSGKPQTLQLTITGQVEKHCGNSNWTDYWYTCKT
jgi:hypothetical protein